MTTKTACDTRPLQQDRQCEHIDESQVCADHDLQAQELDGIERLKSLLTDKIKAACF